MTDRSSYLDAPGGADTPAAGQVPFVPRGGPLEQPPLGNSGPTLGLGSAALRAILLLTLLLQAFTWMGLEGYQLADSVEYMERAYAFVRAEDVIDAHTIRSFGFSALLVPFFWVAEMIGVEDYTTLVWIVRLFQMTIGLALVVVSARIGERLGGRITGLFAALIVGSNPVFLQFSVSPLADVAGSLGVALTLNAILARRPGFKGGLGVGLFMGLALLMAYKTAPISAVLVGMVVLRDRRKSLPPLTGMVVGIGLCVALQLGLDRLVYGQWGASFVAYFGENVVGITSRVLTLSGLGDLGGRLYIWYYEIEGVSDFAARPENLRQIQPAGWYLTHLTEMLSWPILAGLTLGLVRGLRRATWASSLLIAATVAHVFLLHQKGSKEFRLWLPLLATLGPLAGWGFAWVWGRRGERSGLRPTLVVGALVVSVVLASQVQLERNTRKHSGYWRALDYIEARVAEQRAADPDLPKARLASAYHWTVFLRTSSDIELTKLRHQIDGWAKFGDPQRNAVYPVLRDQDWFIVHQPILSNPGHQDLAYAVNAWYEVEAMFWDRETFEDLGPIYVMRRRQEGPARADQRTLFDVRKEVSPEDALALSRELGFSEPVRMIKKIHGEEMWMLGFTYEELPGDGHGWLTTWWYNKRKCLADYTFIERLTTFDERNSWQNNHAPIWGVQPTSQWAAGTLVRESWPVVAAREPYNWQERYRPMGGPYRRGDYMPAYLWIDVATFYWRCNHCGQESGAEHGCGGVQRDPDTDRSKTVSGRLERARWGARQPLRVGPMAGATRSEEGWRWSPDDLVLAGRFFLPVHATARVPDDGRPVPD
jgi:hypothetical protein